jgi:hypothetical protein
MPSQTIQAGDIVDVLAASARMNVVREQDGAIVIIDVPPDVAGDEAARLNAEARVEPYAMYLGELARYVPLDPDEGNDDGGDA